MTISFFSNYLNSHQLPFCEAIIRKVGEDNFRFVATTKMDEDRVLMGWENMNETRPFVVQAYKGGIVLEQAKRLAKDSDVVIFGAAPEIYFDVRMAENKLTFRYTERLLKKGLIYFFDPRFLKMHYPRYTKNRNKEMYVLCASAYTKNDLALLGINSSKCFKWGYFPEMKKNVNYEHVLNKKNGLKYPYVSLLWAGRLIDWKHPEVALSVAKHLKERGYDYHMTIIGDGPMREKLEKDIMRHGISGQVRMLGAQSHDAVLEEMERSDIFLFTSDRNEGWGAVLNEAMNAGCAIIADKNIGSVPFLIKDGVNGLIFSTGRLNQVFAAVDKLMTDRKYRCTLGEGAWNTINNEWSIDNATKNLFELIDKLQNKSEPNIQYGPCSYA